MRTTEPPELVRLRSAARQLVSIVPAHWWTIPPNKATRDVVEGIKALGIDPDWWREEPST